MVISFLESSTTTFELQSCIVLTVTLRGRWKVTWTRFWPKTWISPEEAVPTASNDCTGSKARVEIVELRPNFATYSEPVSISSWRSGKGNTDFVK
jgi:hypothetical protein